MILNQLNKHPAGIKYLLLYVFSVHQIAKGRLGFVQLFKLQNCHQSNVGEVEMMYEKYVEVALVSLA